MLEMKYGKRRVNNCREARMVTGSLTAKNKIESTGRCESTGKKNGSGDGGGNGWK